MSSIHVKPAPGRVIRAPDGQIIPPEGLHLVRDLYLDRRIAEGDLVVVEDIEAPEAEQSAQPATAIEPAQPASSPLGAAKPKKRTDA